MSLRDTLSSKLNQLQFRLRDRWLGELSLRRQLPAPASALSRSIGERAFYKQLIEKTIDPLTARSFELVWDVGCRNWSYAPALAESFANASLIGVEVDGARRYLNGYRRRDFAVSEALALTFEGRPAECLFADFRALDVAERTQGYEAVAFCFFFPFVSANPCLKWGLPLDYARFAELLAHAQTASERAGAEPFFLSAHQGEWEAKLAREAYAAAGLAAPRETVFLAADHAGLWPSPHDVHVLISRR